MASRQEFEALAGRLGKSMTRSAIHNGAYLVPSTQDMWVAYQLGAGMLTEKPKVKWYSVGRSAVHPDRTVDLVIILPGFDLPTRREIDHAVTMRELMPDAYWVSDTPSLYVSGIISPDRLYGRVVFINRG